MFPQETTMDKPDPGCVLKSAFSLLASRGSKNKSGYIEVFEKMNMFY